MRNIIILALSLFSASAHARRWEFSCQSLDGKIAFNRAYLNLAEKDVQGRDTLRTFRNFNLNNDPAYADERSPLAFGNLGKSAKEIKTTLLLVNLKPGQDAVAHVKLNRVNKYCARNSHAYTTTFRVLYKNQASFVPFHCEEGWFATRIDAERCQWQPRLSPTFR